MKYEVGGRFIKCENGERVLEFEIVNCYQHDYDNDFYEDCFRQRCIFNDGKIQYVVGKIYEVKKYYFYKEYPNRVFSCPAGRLKYLPPHHDKWEKLTKNILTH